MSLIRLRLITFQIRDIGPILDTTSSNGDTVDQVK